MKSKWLKQFIVVASLVVLTIPMPLSGRGNQSDQTGNEKEEPFVLTSSTFTDRGTLPVSMALNQ
jgi:hypothetical protein